MCNCRNILIFLLPSMYFYCVLQPEMLTMEPLQELKQEGFSCKELTEEAESVLDMFLQ